MKEKQLYYRLRNIVYYYSIDERPRAIWIHVIRGLRTDAGKVDPVTDFSTDLLSAIPPRVTESEAREIIPGILTEILTEYAEQFETAP